MGSDAGRFEPVVIEPRGGHYRLAQGEELLLSMPRALFEAYEADSVFPPAWQSLDPAHPVRRLFWNPQTAEFLMAGLETHPVRTVEAFGTTPYRSYLQALWLPAPPLLLLRPHWNPPDPADPFDAPARRKSFEVQRRFLDLVGRLRPPPGWGAVLNATDPYLEALGVVPEGPGGSPEALWEVSLTPPAPLDRGDGAAALEELATACAGRLFPALRGGALAAVHALALRDQHESEALLTRHGLAHQRGPFRPH